MREDVFYGGSFIPILSKSNGPFFMYPWEPRRALIRAFVGFAEGTGLAVKLPDATLLRPGVDFVIVNATQSTFSLDVTAHDFRNLVRSPEDLADSNIWTPFSSGTNDDPVVIATGVAGPPELPGTTATRVRYGDGSGGSWMRNDGVAMTSGVDYRLSYYAKVADGGGDLVMNLNVNSGNQAVTVVDDGTFQRLDVSTTAAAFAFLDIEANNLGAKRDVDITAAMVHLDLTGQLMPYATQADVLLATLSPGDAARVELVSNDDEVGVWVASEYTPTFSAEL